MANIKAKIRSNDQTITARTVQIQSGSLRLSDLADVDASGQAEGAVMQYNASTGKYEIKKEINGEGLIIVGGTF